MNVDKIIADTLAEYPDSVYVCTHCGGAYNRLPWGGYCDESLECTGADLYEVATKTMYNMWD